MELMDVIRNRRSIRKYKPDPVPEDEIKYILEAARLALLHGLIPSAGTSS